VSRPASLPAAVGAQTAMEARLTARRGENLLAMIGIPAGALVFFGAIGHADATRLESLLPGVLALALVASGLVNLGIATAYERGYGVLKRLGGSPLGRDGLVSAKLIVVLVIAVAQVVGLLVVAWLLGWRPGPGASPMAIALATVVGAAASTGLGLLLAGTLRPEAVLVVANVLFLVALALCGAVIPLGELPDALAAVARVLPFGAMSEAFAAALGGSGTLARPLLIIAVWAIVGLVAAARTFQWE
jgi:ABC-2 type transport system permease protein